MTCTSSLADKSYSYHYAARRCWCNYQWDIKYLGVAAQIQFFFQGRQSPGYIFNGKLVLGESIVEHNLIDFCFSFVKLLMPR